MKLSLLTVNKTSLPTVCQCNVKYKNSLLLFCFESLPCSTVLVSTWLLFLKSECSFARPVIVLWRSSICIYLRCLDFLPFTGLHDRNNESVYCHIPYRNTLFEPKDTSISLYCKRLGNKLDRIGSFIPIFPFTISTSG